MPRTATRRRATVNDSGEVIPPRPDEPINPAAMYLYEEAGAHLRLSERAVRKLVHAGRLGHTELNGRRWRVSGRHILDFIERNTVPPIRR